MAGRPATAGDLAHVWLMSHPPPKGEQQGGLRERWKRAGHSDKALDFWIQ